MSNNMIKLRYQSSGTACCSGSILLFAALWYKYPHTPIYNTSLLYQHSYIPSDITLVWYKYPQMPSETILLWYQYCTVHCSERFFILFSMHAQRYNLTDMTYDCDIDILKRPLTWLYYDINILTYLKISILFSRHAKWHNIKPISISSHDFNVISKSWHKVIQITFDIYILEYPVQCLYFYFAILHTKVTHISAKINSLTSPVTWLHYEINNLTSPIKYLNFDVDNLTCPVTFFLYCFLDMPCEMVLTKYQYPHMPFELIFYDINTLLGMSGDTKYLNVKILTCPKT